ncbi:MAG: thiamine pyrophosphate-binding protein [Candidatus Thorarchaeota archaeon]|nr:MAG: thiamine pyrophosphate-binding protein [Candidatus Thorarchaeota archaeon]
MSMLTGGEVLARCLIEEGVRYVFGVPGDQLYPLLDEIYQQEGIEFITFRHEQAAAHAADAWARTTGNPGVCLGTVGPGAADLVPGVYAAHADSIPMIVLCAQNQSWRILPDHGSSQGLDQLSLFKPITKWGATVSHWQRIPHLVHWAFREAMSGRPGPVFLEVPSDVLYMKCAEDTLIDGIVPADKYRVTKPPIGDPTLISRAAKMLLEAEFPLIHAGGGVLASEASREIVELAEHLQSPVTTSLIARGSIPEDHELSLVPASFGAIGAQCQSDLVLLVGGKLGDLDFWGRAPGWAECADQQLIQIDVAPEMIALNRVVDLAIVGDAKSTLAEILKIVKNSPKAKPREDMANCREAQENWLADFREQGKSDQIPIHPLRLIQEVRDFYPRDAISIADGGNIVVWSVYLNRIYRPRTFLWPSDSGHLGVGTGYAIGAKLAHPEKEVYVISGDGAFMFNAQELETARRRKIPFTVIIGNDRAYGMIKAGQKGLYDERYVGVDFTDTRYDKMAEAMGCFGIRVDTPEKIGPALEEARNSGLPAVVDVVVDPDVNLAPPDFESVASVWLEGCQLPGEE